jgi:hypothetical protein
MRPWQIIFCLNVFEANVYVHDYGYEKLFCARMRLQQMLLSMNVDMGNHVVYECHYRKCWFINMAMANHYFSMNVVTTNTLFFNMAMDIYSVHQCLYSEFFCS